MSQVIFTLGAILFLAYVFLLVFDRTRIPDVLLLILVGVVLGPYVLGMTSPADFGKVGAVLSTVALIVVLLLGGVELDLDTLATALRPTLLLTLVTFVATMALVAAIGRFVLELSGLMALTMGAILGGTSSAVVIPIVRSLRLPVYPATILTLESALTDVLTIVLASALMGAAVAQGGGISPLALIGSLVSSMTMATILGVASGLLWLWLLHVSPNSEEFVLATVAFALLVFGVADGLGFNGGIAVLTFGLTLSNWRAMKIDRIPALGRLTFGSLKPRDHAANRQGQFLLKVFFFVYLGISIPFRDGRLIALAFVTVVLVYLARHVIVRFTVNTRQLDTTATAALCALAPKGLAAAVLAGQPLRLGLQGGEVIEDFSFMVVLISITLTAIMVALSRLDAVRAAYGRMAGKAGAEQAVSRL
jgi:potassium/hydrogen antiporter